MDPYLSVVIPTFNEEKNIEETLKKVFGFLFRKDFSWEVIVSDDGSKDKTVKIAEGFLKNHPNLRILKNSHQGKGPTVISGMSEAKGEIVVFTDADLATPIEELDKLIDKFREGFDVVIGSRGAKREGAPPLRQLLASGFNFLVQVVALPGISDTQCGFKGFRKSVFNQIIARTKIFNHQKDQKELRVSAVTPIFDVELLFIAKKLGLKIAQAPVVWHHVRTKRVSPMRDSILTLFDITRLRINDLRGMYD